MAYAGTVTFFPPTVDGVAVVRGREFLIIIAETECAATSEATINFSRQVTLEVNRYEVVQASGTGTTINPRFGPATNPDGMGGVLMLSGGAAAPPKSVDTGGARVTTDTSGRLFHRTVPNAGADNTYTVKIWAKVV